MNIATHSLESPITFSEHVGLARTTGMTSEWACLGGPPDFQYKFGNAPGSYVEVHGLPSWFAVDQSLNREVPLDYRRRREALVEHELKPRGIQSESVIRAMLEVPREEFVPEDRVQFAYRNAPLPIGSGQTISQPLIVAQMAEALAFESGDRVLEVGTGSGYAAAVLSRIAEEVFTIERHNELADFAVVRLKKLGYGNVHVRRGDGTLGWPEEAPFDAIIVSASGPSIPRPLLKQLRVGGRLVIPVGDDLHSQDLVLAVRHGENRFDTTKLGGVRFVPLIGEAGWPENLPMHGNSNEA